MTFIGFRTDRYTSLVVPLCLIFSLTGCSGPSVPKSDLTEYVKKTMPAGLELTDLTYQAVAGKDSQTGGALLVHVKVTARSREDFYSAPTRAEDIKAVNDFVGAYNRYISWTNAMQMTSYAAELNRDKPKIDANPPKFLHRDYAKGETFTGYLDVAAEHQVDRWIFKNITNVDWGDKKPQFTAAAFGPHCVGANAPDGEAVARKFLADEASMDHFRAGFAAKHATESQPLVQALQPLLTSARPVQTFAMIPGNEVPNFRMTFSAYDPSRQHFRVRYQNVMADYNGDGEIDGNYIVLFQEPANSQPAAVGFVGVYDARTGDIVMREGGQNRRDSEVLHTRSK